MASPSISPPSGYALGVLLGRGAFGEVYRATRIVDGADLACKIISLVGTPVAQRRSILREVAVLRSLHHDGIVRFIDGIEHNGSLFIFTELCERGDLAKFVEGLPDQRIQPEDFKSLSLSILRALRYLHLEKIIHRDVKPANILIAADGTPKLADLGVSKSLHGTLSLRGSTVSGMSVAGTFAFMDPHVLVLEDDEPDVVHAEYGVKADVWSLGITFYTILSGGEFPLKSKKAIKALAKGDDASRAWRMPAFDPALGIPEEVARFVQRCLTPDQEARPDTKALLEDPILHGIEPFRKTGPAGGASSAAAVSDADAHREAERRKKQLADEAESDALLRRLALLKAAEDEAREAAIRRQQREADALRRMEALRRATAEEEASRAAARQREAMERFNQEQRMMQMMQEQAQAQAFRAQQAARAQIHHAAGGGSGGRCNGITQAGARCKNPAQAGRRYCRHH